MYSSIIHNVDDSLDFRERESQALPCIKKFNLCTVNKTRTFVVYSYAQSPITNLVECGETLDSTGKQREPKI